MDDVAVRVICVTVPLVHVAHRMRVVGAEVTVRHLLHLELPASSGAVAVAQLVSRDQGALELDARLPHVLLLALDAVHLVIGHCQRVPVLGIPGVPRGGRQAVQVVIAVGVAHRGVQQVSARVFQ